MKIIQGRAGSGTRNELLKKFLEDTNSATLISDEMGIKSIFNKIEYLKSNGVNIVDNGSKQIKTGMYTNCNSDYFAIVQDIKTDSIYLDISISKDFNKVFIDFCLDLESEYGLNIEMTEQLPADSDVKGIKILEIKK